MSREDQDTIQITHPEQLIETNLSKILIAVRAACHFHKYKPTNDEIRDLCQDLILRLAENNYRRLRLFDNQKASFSTWIKVIARHHISNYIHRYINSQKKISSLDELAFDSFIYQPSQETNMIIVSKVRKLRATLIKLSEREQYFFKLLCIDELNTEEIAQLMGINVDAVYRSKHALIKKLQKLI